MLHATGYRILQSSNPHILKYYFSHNETHKSYNKITLEQISKIEKILENKRLEDCSFT